MVLVQSMMTRIVLHLPLCHADLIIVDRTRFTNNTYNNTYTKIMVYSPTSPICYRKQKEKYNISIQ